MSKRLVVVSAAAVLLGVAALIVSQVVTFSHDGGADAGLAATTPVASSRVIVQSAAGSPSPSPTAAASPSKAPARPSATASPSKAPAVAPLAGRIRPKVTYHGVATWYDAGNGGGACLYDPSSDLMFGAMNETDYESSKACGAYVRIQNASGASVTIRIVNECPLPCATGQIDLSQAAFAKLGDPHLGRMPITWTLVSPSTSATISIRYKAGSSRWWCGIQVIGHRNPVARLEVRTNKGWKQLPRASFNYFISAHGTGCGGGIRVTDIYGQRLVINGISLLPDVAQPTRVQFARH